MRIFTNRGFEEELKRRMEAKAEYEWNRRRFAELEERIEQLYRIVANLRLSVCEAERKEDETS